MKNKLLFPVFIIILFSCQKTELEFSCNPVINNFVKEKQAELSVLMLDQFLYYDLPMQRAIFNSWDPWKKRDIWIEKLERIAKSEALSVDEIEYIQQLIEHIHSDYFLAENVENEKEMRILFAQRWMDEVKSNLGWTDKFVAFLVYRLYTDKNQFDRELSELKSIEKSASSSSECTCSSSFDFCYDSLCAVDGCSIGSGCGLFWSMSCDGNCI